MRLLAYSTVVDGTEGRGRKCTVSRCLPDVLREDKDNSPSVPAGMSSCLQVKVRFESSVLNVLLELLYK